MKLTRNTGIADDISSIPINTAADILRRDLDKTLTGTEPGGTVRLASLPLPPEMFELSVREDTLTVSAGSGMGFVYGLLEISRRFLGVKDLWFWMDQTFNPVETIEIPEGFRYVSRPSAVRYRGWFINDEVLLNAWDVDGDPVEPWRMTFEALLRLGGNLVIPGTDRNAHKYRDLAASYGLIITHHHAEPLGAEMFARAYPELEPSFGKYPELFRGMWRTAVEEQRDTPTVFNIGFRGQGDRPFWVDDPAYDTPEKRGRLMSALIREQYDLVKSLCPGAECCTNLYGEAMELYRDGFLKLPEDVIRVWADNGYGKMVSRRQGNHDPRVSSMPDGSPGRHGIYYHASFYDLQAASHMTLLPNSPEFVMSELKSVLSGGGDDMWIVNCSNVKPHVYILSLIAQMWRCGDVDVERFSVDYFTKYYGKESAENLCVRHREFWDCAPAFGAESDQHAGDQFPNYTIRALVTQYLRDRAMSCPELQWACAGDSLETQLLYFSTIFKKARSDYSAYVQRCDKLLDGLPPKSAQLWEDSVLLQARYLYLSYAGADAAAESMLLALNGRYRDAFRLAGRARKMFLYADDAQRGREHGKWRGFYANDCLVDVKFTAHILEGFMAAVRALGDGPEYWMWQREAVCDSADRRVVLITNMENRMSDLELYERMEENECSALCKPSIES